VVHAVHQEQARKFVGVGGGLKGSASNKN
jgi:hypothetical protein